MNTVLAVILYGSHEQPFANYTGAGVAFAVAGALHIVACLIHTISYYIIIAPLESRPPRTAKIGKVATEEHDDDDEVQQVYASSGWLPPPDPPKSELDRYFSTEAVCAMLSLPMGWWSIICLLSATFASFPPNVLAYGEKNIFFCTIGMLDYFRYVILNSGLLKF